MSGAEAIVAIQLIDACIGIANTIIDIGRAVHDAQGLPPKLRDLADKLPAIEELLESAHENFREGKSAEDASKNAQHILKQCEQALGDLREIFRKACPEDGDNRGKRIWKGVKTVFFGRDSQVQKLLVAVQDNLKLLEQKEIYVIGDKLDELQELTEALGHEDSGKYAHSGQGNIIANEGGRPTNYVQSGSHNRQVNNPGVYHEGSFNKSQLAIEYAYRAREQSPLTWVLWIPTSSAARFELSIRDTLDQLRVSGRHDPQANVFQLFRSWLRDVRKGKWLLILDNLDDARFLLESPSAGEQRKTESQRSLSGERYIDYVPSSDHGSVLITTRSRDAALKVVQQNDTIAVEPMDEEHARALVEKKLGDQYDRDEITELAKISFEHIHEVRPSAADLLSLMSFFDRQSIPQSLLQTRNISKDDGQDTVRKRKRIKEYGPASHSSSDGDSHGDGDTSHDIEDNLSDNEADEFKDDITMLRSYSFVSVTTENNFFEMHRLVQLGTQRWLRAQGRLERWAYQFISNLEDAFPTGRHEDWHICQTIYPHVKASLGLKLEGRAAVLRNASLLYRSACRKRELGPDDEATLKSTFMLSLAEKGLGLWREAEELQVPVMETMKRVLGEEHSDTLTSIANLATTYWNQGRLQKAEELEVQVMETRKRVLGEEHPATLACIGNLASTYTDQGQWKKAEELEMQVLETRKRVLGQEHPDTLTSMANLAATYWNQGRWREAEKLQVQVIETSKRVLGEEQPDTLTSMGNLASTYWNQGRQQEAKELEIQVMETRTRLLGDEHPNTLTSMANFASVYKDQGQWQEAEELEVQVLETRKRVLGDEHPDTLTSMANLALTYSNQGRWQTAEELQVQVIEIMKRVLGEEHPNTLTSMSNLVSTYRNQEQWHKAGELEEQVMETRKRVLGEEHPDTLSGMNNLALTYSDQGRWQEAEGLGLQVIEMSVGNLASVYRDQGQWQEAEELEEQVLETRKRVLGEEHPDTLLSMNNLAATCSNQGRWQTAEEL
ncbi:hypothetical protein LTR22_027643 [Elasticomyces elasticus]|nr:hypothetical protein LTR22_027643 [Elasticomyces elasticus]KAK4895669.1 hypothetical protein LTR49_028239 [Elasticomyces elasticus]